MQPWVSGALQAKPFFFATTKNRIGRGPRRCCYDHCRRNHSSLQQQKLESDAEDRCRDDCCRRNHSPLRQRRLESDAEVRCRDGRFRRAILLCGTKNRIGCGRSLPRRALASIRKSGPEIKNRCTLEGVSGENPASILKFEPEIKNRCTQDGINGQNLAVIPKFGPKIKNRCRE